MKEKEKIKSYDVDAHVASLSEVKKEIAEEFITGFDLDEQSLTHYFDNIISGPCEISYPLTNPVIINIKNESTIGGLLWEIANKYKEIYQEEEESATTKTIPEEERIGLINRNQTDGKYGIWGHDLSDLYFEGLLIQENGQIKIHIGS